MADAYTHMEHEAEMLALKQTSLFASIADDILIKIARELVTIRLDAYKIIFAKNDVSDSMFILKEGSVRVHDEYVTFTQLDAPSTFGEYSIIDSSLRTASVTTITPVTLIALSQSSFFNLMSTHQELMQSVMKAMVQRVKDKDRLEEELASRNAEIVRQKEEIESQRDEIEAQRDMAEQQRDQILEQKREITDSIFYARRIQQAMLVPEQNFKNLFPDSFILYKPRDIVSGDFYWINQKDDLIAIAAADCTGHGVPGALMSVLGISLLNEIFLKINEWKPSEILFELRNMVIKSLNQTGKDIETKDGLDISLCIVNTTERKVTFSGAYHSVYFISEGELTEYRGDKMPIGITFRIHNSFTETEHFYKPGDFMYLTTDGYIDQFGGPSGRKFLAKQFKELLVKLHPHDFTLQVNILDNTISDWMLEYGQLDDILVIGIKL